MVFVFSMRVFSLSIIFSRLRHASWLNNIPLCVLVCVCVFIYTFMSHPWRRTWQPTPLFLPVEFHRHRSLGGYNPWDCRVRHDWVTFTHFAHSYICLEVCVYMYVGIYIYTYIYIYIYIWMNVLVTQSCLTLWDPIYRAHQAPLPMEFPRQDYWCWLPVPSSGDLPDTRMEAGSPALQADTLPSEPPGKTVFIYIYTGSDGKTSAYNKGDLGSIPGSGRSPGEGNGKPL